MSKPKDHVTAEQFRAMKAKPTASKYRNVRTAYGGVKYDSRAEAARARELDLLKSAGEIVGWTRQVPFMLSAIVYRADFLVFGLDGFVWAEDVKGKETQRFRDVRRLWAVHGPCDLSVITKTGTEIIEGRVVPRRRVVR